MPHSSTWITKAPNDASSASPAAESESAMRRSLGTLDRPRSTSISAESRLAFFPFDAPSGGCTRNIATIARTRIPAAVLNTAFGKVATVPLYIRPKIRGWKGESHCKRVRNRINDMVTTSSPLESFAPLPATQRARRTACQQQALLQVSTQATHSVRRQRSLQRTMHGLGGCTVPSSAPPA